MSPSKENNFEQFKAVTGATLRSMAAHKDLEVNFTAGEPPIGQVLSLTRPRLPLPNFEMDETSVRLVRGCGDAYALKIAAHDPTLHMRLAPRDAQALAAFEGMEQARVEAIGMNVMSGVKDNLSAVLEEKCRRRGYDHITTREQAGVGDALHILTRMALTGETPPSSAQKVIDLWRPWMEERLGKKLEQAFNKDNIRDQSAFASLAKQMIRALDMPIPEDGDGNDDSGLENDEQDQTETKDNESPDNADDQQDDSAFPGSLGEEDGESGEGDSEEFDSGYEEMLNDMSGEGEGNMPSPPRFNDPDGFIAGREGAYHIYTTEFDEEIAAADLADTFEMTRLREALDKQLSSHQAIITKLANRLQRKLMAQQLRSWQFDLEEGILDPSRSPALLQTPPPLYPINRKGNGVPDTIVTLLIDNSGSMRGRPIAIAAMTTDIVARTLERCGVKVEILGFTTRAWKGGKSRDLWMQNGRPENPGRLNDIRHIIYKAADEPWRRTRKNIGLMLKEGILKENIDGEALVWAHNRLAARGEARKIILVISDARRSDDSTLSANPANLLELDLRNVIEWIENRSKIELAAIGIGHDVTRYYKKAITIQDADGLAQALVAQLGGLFEEHK
ncbi:MAG: cobaltochelatase subunit CobT [Alphaproteobacteria bacterium]|nr:cobaltochelatase subunit CobT [Alphaproteobacteria bacterium]